MNTTSPEPFYVLPDTNLFLQARALTELPWQELAPGREIIIVVPRAVQKELSRLKSDGNGRRAKRARASTALIRQAATAPEHRIHIRDREPRVSIQLPSPTRATVPPDDLDLNTADDRIMAEIISFRTQNPGKEAVILTDDTDQIVSANHHQVPYVEIPESWFLAPETDERDKRIAELQQEVRLLKRAEPTIQIVILNKFDKPVEELTIEREWYPPLSKDVIDQLIKEAVGRCPPEPGLRELIGKRRSPNAIEGVLMAGTLFGSYKAPTEEEVVDYYDRTYPNWVINLESALSRIHSELNAPSSYMAATLLIENQGTRPADGVILRIEAQGAIKLVGEVPVDDLSLPKPPRPPTGEYVRQHRGIEDMLRHGFGPSSLTPHLYSPAPIRDPNAFYGRRDGKPQESWEFNCDEFRHGDQRRLSLGMLVNNTLETQSGALSITMTARNMGARANHLVPVRVQTIHRETINAVRPLFDERFKRKLDVTIHQVGQRDQQ